MSPADRCQLKRATVPSRHQHRPSPALIVAVGALVLALAGTAPAQSVVASATRLVTGKSIRDGSVELRDLSRRARAQLRGKQGSPGAAGRPGLQGATGRPGEPGPAGQDAQLSPLEPRQMPQMQNGWFDAGVRFYKDRSGLVHIEGRAVAPTTGGPHGGTIFTLPEGYRPPSQSLFVYSAAGETGDLLIEGDGRVRPGSPLPTNQWNVHFGTLTFRPAGA